MRRSFALWSSCILLATTSTYAWVTPANIATSMVSTRPGSVASRVALHAPPLQRQVHAARRAARGQLRMSGDLSVVVQSVTSAPLSSNNCVKDICSTALGFVTCKVTGGDKLVLNTQPLASSFFAVGTAQGSDVIVPCGSDARKGQTLSVASNLAVPVPAGWSKDQAGLFPALCILFLQGLQGAGIGSLSQLSGKTVLVTGGLGPAASLALQLCAAAGARVVATGSESERSRLEEMGAGVVIDYRKESFWDKLQADGVQLFLVIDGLGAGGGTELSALEKAKVKYVSAMHPAVALVVREGLWTGGRALQRHVSGEEASCAFEASDEAMALLRDAAQVLARAGASPRFGKEAYTAGEWMEAMGWPKDTDTGNRYGFPGKNLWDAPAFTNIEAASEQGFVPIGLPSEEEVYAMDKEAELEALKEVFNRFDKDASGLIDMAELRAAASELRLTSSEEELNALMQKVDTDGDGKISFEEFEAANIAKVQEVDSFGTLLELVSGQRPALIEFHAPFCRTCRNMRGRFAKLPGRRPDAIFLSVDVKKHRDIADELDVKDVPSYVLYKNGEKRGQWKGAFRVDQLEAFIDVN